MTAEYHSSVGFFFYQFTNTTETKLNTAEVVYFEAINKQANARSVCRRRFNSQKSQEKE